MTNRPTAEAHHEHEIYLARVWYGTWYLPFGIYVSV